MTPVHPMMKSWLSRFICGPGALLLSAGLLALAFSGRAAEPATTDPPTDPMSDDSPPYISPTNGLGSWIWASNTFNGQTCQFWNTFEIPAGAKVAKARLVMTMDNEFTLYLDGRELGHGAEWRELFIFDLTPLLTPGLHVLAVKGINSFGFAGMLLGMHVDLADGRTIEVQSDKSWRIVPDNAHRWEKRTEAQMDWPPAKVTFPFGSGPYWTHPINVNRMPLLRPIQIYFWQTGWFQISLLSVSALIVLISFRLMAQLALHRKERRLLQQERARIAREIHDDIGSRMTQLVLHGEVAQNGLPAGSETQVQLGQICEEARGLLSTMDEILWAVNPRRDTLRDFTAYVTKYAQEFLAPTKIQCIFEVDPEMSVAAFELPLRRSLLMAIKETLNNAVKHSGATELRLQIHWQGQWLVVVVQDNGKGFDRASAKSERNGLVNMAQRMSELGGDCQVTSQPGQGCRVELKIPLKRPRQNSWAWLWTAKPFPGLANETQSGHADEPSQNHDFNK
jgi:signal transduction histidine kinase